MATYKVIQDVEAEDKLLGPLTLRQFVYAGITGTCLYLCYFVASKGAGFLIVALLPPAIVCAFFAFPWSKEQPTELWALARIRFMFKPRVRIWDQSGIKELVHINVPKRVEEIFTDGLTQSEVRSRLQALATTIDSRGWAVKNPNVTAGFQNADFTSTANSVDRLVDYDDLHQHAANEETYTDMLDETAGVGQKFDTMLNQQTKAHRDTIETELKKMDTPLPKVDTKGKQQSDFWFMNESTRSEGPAGFSQFGSQVISPGTQSDPVVKANLTPEEEKALVEKLKQKTPEKAFEYSHLPTILPLAEQEKLAKEKAKQEAEHPETKELAGWEVASDQAAADSDQGESAYVPKWEGSEINYDNAQPNDSGDKFAASYAEDDQQSLQKNSDADDGSKVTDEPDAAILELASKRSDGLSVATLAREAKKAHGEDLGDDEVVIRLH